MKQKQNKVYIGLDTVEIDIRTCYEVTKNNYQFYSMRTGEVIGTLRHKQGNEYGYRLNICLPKCVRSDNVIPLTPLLDGFRLYEISEMVSTQMRALFGKNYPEMLVSTCEVNCTAEIDKRNVAPMLNMLGHVLLSGGGKLFVAAHGKKSGKRYEKVSSIKSGMEIESLKTEQLSNSRESFKFYNKSLEQEITNKGLIRLESIFNRRGLNYAGAGRTLEEFLTVKSIQCLLSTYRSDYKTYLIDRFWNNRGGESFCQQAIRIVENDLRSFQHPLSVALMNREICEWDFAFYEKACYKCYQNRKSATQAIRRVRNSGELDVHEGVIDDFVSISKAIVYG